jgi:hypothetical protein
MIAWNVTLLIAQLLGAGLDLLEAEQVRGPGKNRAERVFLERRAYSINIPGDNLHTTSLCGKLASRTGIS